GGATESQYPKLSYVMRFDPWGWVIGSGVYVDDVGALVRERLAGRARLVLLIAVPLIALAALLATTITRPLLRGARALEAMRQGRRRLAALPVERDDEIGTLIDGFNRLHNDLKDKTEALARSNAELEQLATVFTHAREGVMITAPDGTILNVNQSFSRISGYSRDELIGSNPRMLKSGHQDDVFYAGMWQALTDTGHWSGEIWNRHKQGHLYAELLTISAVRDAHGQTRHYVSLISDITTQKEYQQQLEYIAHYDVLTALPNRMLLADRLRQAIAQAQRERCRVAVVYIDLDGFKAINDTHGHAAGDALLMAVAQRMQQCLRGQDTIARLGGDEFVALLTALPEQYDVRPLAQRLLEAASLPVQHGALQLQVSCSIGITYHDPGGPGDEEQLLIEADQAMYQAKLAGKNTLHVYGQGQAPTPAPCTTSGLS
ncbi:MAG: diguanylate cyclase, partial [Rhodocyclaceae bacterium]